MEIVSETVPGGKTRQHFLACAGSRSLAAKREPDFLICACAHVIPKLSPECSKGGFASLVISRSHIAVCGLII